MDSKQKKQCNRPIKNVINEKNAEIHDLKEINKKLLEEKEKNNFENTNLKEEICNLKTVIATMILEKSVLEEKLKDKMQLIHSFAERTDEARKTPGLKSLTKLSKEFQKIDTNLNLWYSDVLSVTSLVQDIQVNCNNCKERHKKDKETYEKTILTLEGSKINNEFLIHQLTHQVNQYAEEIQNLKKKEMPTKKVTGIKELRFSGSMPPTPESCTNSHDIEESMQSLLGTSSCSVNRQKPLFNNSKLLDTISNSPPECCSQNSPSESVYSYGLPSPTCQTKSKDKLSVTKISQQKSPVNKNDDVTVDVIPKNKPIKSSKIKEDENKPMKHIEPKNKSNHIASEEVELTKEETKSVIKPICKIEEFSIQNEFLGFISSDSEDDDNFESKIVSKVENLNTSEPRLVDKSIAKVITEESSENKATSLKKPLKKNPSKVSNEQDFKAETVNIKQTMVLKAESDLPKDEKSIGQTFKKPATPGSSPRSDDFEGICKHLRIPKMLSPVHSLDKDKNSIKVKKETVLGNTDENITVVKETTDKPVIADQKRENQLDIASASTLNVTQELGCYDLQQTNASKSIFSPQLVSCEENKSCEKLIKESRSPVKNSEVQFEFGVRPKIQSASDMEEINQNNDEKLDINALINELPVTSLNAVNKQSNFSKESTPKKDQINLEENQIILSSVIESVSKSPKPLELEIENLSYNSGNGQSFQELLTFDKVEPSISVTPADYKEKHDDSNENDKYIADLIPESEITNLLNSSLDETFIETLLLDDDQDMPLDLSFKENVGNGNYKTQEENSNKSDKPLDLSSPLKLQKPKQISTVVSVSPDTTTISPNTKLPLKKKRAVLEKLPLMPKNIKKSKNYNKQGINSMECLKTRKKGVKKGSDLDLKPITQRAPVAMKNYTLRTKLSPTSIPYQEQKSPNLNSKKNIQVGDKKPETPKRSPQGLEHYSLRTNLSPTSHVFQEKSLKSPNSIPYQEQKSPNLNSKKNIQVGDKKPETPKRSPKGLEHYNLRTNLSPTSHVFQEKSLKSPNSNSKKSPKNNGIPPVSTSLLNSPKSPKISPKEPRSDMTGSSKKDNSSLRSPEGMKNYGLRPFSLPNYCDVKRKERQDIGMSPVNSHFLNPQESPQISPVEPSSVMIGSSKKDNSSERSPEGMTNYCLRPLSVPNYCDVRRKEHSSEISPKSLKPPKSCEIQCHSNLKALTQKELKSCNKNEIPQRNKSPCQTNSQFSAKELLFSSREVRGLPPLELPPANIQPIPMTEMLSITVPKDDMPMDFAKYSVFDRTCFGSRILIPFHLLVQQSTTSVIGDKLYSPHESSCKSINSSNWQDFEENSQSCKTGESEINQSTSLSMVIREKERSTKDISQHKRVLNTYQRRRAAKLVNKNLDCNQYKYESSNINKSLYKPIDIDVETEMCKSNVICNQDDLFMADSLTTNYLSYSNALLCMPYEKSSSEKNVRIPLTRAKLKTQNIIWAKSLAKGRGSVQQSVNSPSHSPISRQKSTEGNSLLKTVEDFGCNKTLALSPLQPSVLSKVVSVSDRVICEKSSKNKSYTNNAGNIKTTQESLETTLHSGNVIMTGKSGNNSLTSKIIKSKPESVTPANVMRTYASRLKQKKDTEETANSCSKDIIEGNKTVQMKPQHTKSDENRQSPDKLKSFNTIVLDFTKKENLKYFEDLSLILDSIGVQEESTSHPISNKESNSVINSSGQNKNNVSTKEEVIGLSNPNQSGSKETSSFSEVLSEDQYFRKKGSKLKKTQDVTDYLSQSCNIIKRIESKVKKSDEKKDISPSIKRKIHNEPNIVTDTNNSAESCYKSSFSNPIRKFLKISPLSINEEQFKPNSTTDKNSNCSIHLELPAVDHININNSSFPKKDFSQTSALNSKYNSVPSGSEDNKKTVFFVKGPTIPGTITSSITPVSNQYDTEQPAPENHSLTSSKHENIHDPTLVISSDRPDLKEESSCDSDDKLVMDVDEELLSSMDSFCSSNHDKSSKITQIDESNIEKSSNLLFSPKTQNKTNDLMGEQKLTTPELCYTPSNLKPLPKAMYKYEEKLTKTNVDFSKPENSMPLFSFYQPSSIANNVNTPLDSVVPISCGNNKDFSPKFYTENNPLMNLKEDYGDSEHINKERNVFYNSHGYQKKALKEFLPKGVKVDATGNALRTALSFHGENLLKYVTRNVTEGRNFVKPCPAKISARTAEILQPLISSDIANLVELYKIAESLKSFQCSAIFTGLALVLKTEMERLLSEKNNDKFKNWLFTLDKCTLPSHKSPPVHPRIQALVSLVTLVDGCKEESTKLKSGFIEESLDFLEKIIFGSVEKLQNEGHVEVLMTFGYLYTCLARLRGELVRVRRTMYDLLYCYTKMGLSLSYCILRTWPAVLRLMPIENYYGDPLALAVIHALTRTPPSLGSSNFTRHKILSCHNLLRHTYKFTANTVDGDQLFDMFFSRLCQQDVQEAMILLAKNQSVKWFKHRPMKQLIEVVQQWRQNGEGETEAAAAINILGCVCRSFNAENETELNSLIEFLRDILFTETTPSWMQEVIVLNLCRLSRICWQFCVTVITNWRTNQLSSEILDKIIIDIISKKPNHFWNSQAGLKFLNTR